MRRAGSWRRRSRSSESARPAMSRTRWPFCRQTWPRTSPGRSSLSTAAWRCNDLRRNRLSLDQLTRSTTPPGEPVMADNADKVKDIIEKELGVEREKLTNEASFIEDLGADSLDIVELVMEFEKEFNIDIPDEDAEKLRTVGDAIAYLEAKVSG